MSKQDVDDRAEPAANANLAELLDAAVALGASPGDLRTTNHLASLVVRSGAPISAELHEALLRTHLAAQPHRRDLARSLIDIMLKSGRAPMPPMPSAPMPAVSLEALESEADNGNTIGDNHALYSALWCMVTLFPASSRGWARYAAAFAERRNWPAARDTLAVAMRFEAHDARSTSFMLQALDIISTQNELRGLDWETWFDSLPAESQLDPRGVGLVVQAARPEAPVQVDRLLATVRANPKAELVAALSAFHVRNFPVAYGHLHRAFELDPRYALVEVINKYSSQASRILNGAHKVDEFADWLGAVTEGIDEINLMPNNFAPEGMQQVRRLRQIALDRGLPSPLFVAQGKTASVSVANIFNSGFGLPSAIYTLMTARVVAPWLKDYMRGGACYGTHLESSPRNVELLAAGGVRTAIVHVRDPRQLMVSLMEHHRRYSAYAHAALREHVQKDDDHALRHVVDQALGLALNFLEGWLDAREKIRVEFTTFEDFVTDRDKFLERILDIYGGDTRYFDKDLAFTEQAGTDYHRRAGAIDEWRTRLPPELIEHINARISPRIWENFNWSP